VLANEAKMLSSYFKEENHQAIAKMLPELHVSAFKTTVSDPLQAKDTISFMVQVAAFLLRIAPVLWTVNDLSDNSVVKQALVDLRRESGEISAVENVFDLSKLGLAL
jgi:hypothetical protein